MDHIIVQWTIWACHLRLWNIQWQIQTNLAGLSTNVDRLATLAYVLEHVFQMLHAVSSIL